jgi:predicted esterase
MKNVMIFLHGKGVPGRAPQYRIFRRVAIKEDAETIIIDAPFPHRDGFRWHDYNRNPGAESLKEFEFSMSHIEASVEKILLERKLNWNDLIWLGHSQGGGMAIMAALKHGAKKVIGMMPALDVQLELISKLGPLHLDFPIYWVEAEHEEVIPKDRMDLWMQLKERGANIIHSVSKGSSHDKYAETVLGYNGAE